MSDLAGNFPNQSEGTIHLKLAAMALSWNNPVGEQFIPWLNEVKEAGYDGITGFADLLCGPYLDQPSEFRAILDHHGLSLAAVDFRMHTDFDSYRRLFEFMQALECHLYVCIDPAGTEKDYGKCGTLLNKIGELSAEYHVRTHYHNHTNSVGETFTDMEKLIAELDFHKVSLMLDTGHATKDFTEFPYSERAFHFLNKYWDSIHYLELKDWNEASDLNTPLGEGYTDFQRIFTLMKSKGYSGWITVEQNGNDGLSLGRSAFTCAKISRSFIQENLLT